jgi:ubiquinone/menaquinone biosynthesis C-methylase UbiE
MGPPPSGSEHVQRAARTYGAAADHFSKPALGFWDRYGAATVARLPLAPGHRVADLCCGTGASAIPAARAVGPSGQVTGVDVAEPLLALARDRAADLPQAEFRLGEATGTGLPGASFDAVICVFGVFFVPDRPAFVAEMWRLVRPGGTLAITTWGPDLWEPGRPVFWSAVRDAEPSLYRSWNPWDEITTPDALKALFTQAGVPSPAAEAVPGRVPAGLTGRLLGRRPRQRLPGHRRRPLPRSPRPGPRLRRHGTPVTQCGRHHHQRGLWHGHKTGPILGAHLPLPADPDAAGAAPIGRY